MRQYSVFSKCDGLNCGRITLTFAVVFAGEALGNTKHERPLAIELLGLSHGVYGWRARVVVGDRAETRKVRREWRFGGFVRSLGPCRLR